jgi:hypothetical protein
MNRITKSKKVRSDLHVLSVGEKRNGYKVPVGKYGRNWLFGRRRPRLEVKIKMAPKGTDWERVD